MATSPTRPAPSNMAPSHPPSDTAPVSGLIHVDARTTPATTNTQAGHRAPRARFCMRSPASPHLLRSYLFRCRRQGRRAYAHPEPKTNAANRPMSPFQEKSSGHCDSSRVQAVFPGVLRRPCYDGDVAYPSGPIQDGAFASSVGYGARVGPDPR